MQAVSGALLRGPELVDVSGDFETGPIGKGSSRQTDSGRGAKFVEGSQGSLELPRGSGSDIDSTFAINE